MGWLASGPRVVIPCKGNPPALVRIVEPDLRRCEPSGVKGAPSPLQRTRMLLIGGIGDYGKKLSITRGPTAVFRRTGARAVQASRASHRCGIRREDLLDGDPMIPRVAEVVFVGERAPRPARDLAYQIRG